VVTVRAAELQRVRDVRKNLLEAVASRRDMFPEVLGGLINFEAASEIKRLVEKGALQRPLDINIPMPIAPPIVAPIRAIPDVPDASGPAPAEQPAVLGGGEGPVDAVVPQQPAETEEAPVDTAVAVGEMATTTGEMMPQVAEDVEEVPLVEQPIEPAEVIPPPAPPPLQPLNLGDDDDDEEEFMIVD
jgi:hypothetical protein